MDTVFPTVYNISPYTREFIGTTLADENPLEPGSFLVPALGYLDAPPVAETGYAMVRTADGLGWSKLRDYRGVVYRTDTGEAQDWDALGELSVGLTIKAWPGLYYAWDGSAWKLDEAAQTAGLTAEAKSSRDGLMAVATMRIAPLQDAVDLGDASDKETALLKAWKQYRVALNRIEQQAGFPRSITWPTAPAD